MRFPSILSKSVRHNLHEAFAQPGLKRFLTRNLGLKLLSFVLAVTIWGFIAPQRRGESTEIKFLSPLVLRNIPANMEITSDLVQSVSVLVRVPRALAKTINPNLFQVGINLRNQLPGSFNYQLTGRNVTYNNESAPGDLEVLQISPAQFDLVLEEVVERELEIVPRLVGETAEGLIIESVEVMPSRVRVSGPRTIVEGLRSISTQPLNIEGLETNVEMLVTLEAPHDQVRLLSPEDALYVSRIGVGFQPTRTLLLELPVIFENAEFAYRTSTETVNALVEGPRTSVANLNNRTVFAVIDLAAHPPGDYRGLTPKVVVPDRVTIVEQWPILDLFVLKRRLDEE